ncbi:MAG: hypothetical protein NTU78_14920 [Alphaproteobacteria bacterium]|nr:hypothetical protein [Alphaproteobacteria bacterium]
MPIVERDLWRLQFFEGVDCPDTVLIPTDDPDCWAWHPQQRWIYDKLKIAESQGLACGPHGILPELFPVFSKPMINLKGMGIGSRAMRTPSDFEHGYQPGHMWMELLTGPHVSTDCAIVDGTIAWSRHATGVPWTDGMFKHWTIHAEAMPELDSRLAEWVGRHMRGYTGMMNFETIGGRIIEAHLRFADQWCDLYGAGWVEALVRLYAQRHWTFADAGRQDGFSIPLFAIHGATFRHPPAELQAEIRSMPSVASLQITFNENRDPADHPMPPGGFRLGIVNCTDLAAGFAARRRLASAFPAALIQHQD